MVVFCDGRLVNTASRSSCFGRTRGLLPLRSGGKRVHRLDRLEFLFRDRRQEIAVTHDLDDAGSFSTADVSHSVSCAP
jgi:hypothetical protein